MTKNITIINSMGRDTEKLKRTPLYPIHSDLGAVFGNFGGYAMPLWYDSVREEHLCVLNRVGIFDTSHMSFFTVKGDGALNLIQMVFTRDIDRLKEGYALYGLFLKSDGTVLDDSIVYKIEENNYLFVINSGMSKIVIEHISSFNKYPCIIEDLTDHIGKIDIQGPGSLKVLERLLNPELFNNLSYFSFLGSFDKGSVKINGNPVLVSRSGYTGEFGFEIFIKREYLKELWVTLYQAGSDLGIKPCGLGSRDSLRVGALLPLSHQDIGDWKFCNNPWDFAISKNKSNFVGKDSIIESDSFTFPYVGFDPRKLHKECNPWVEYEGEYIGKVLTCVTEPSLTRFNKEIYSFTSKILPKEKKVRGLVAGFIKINIKLPAGTILTLRDGKRDIKVEIVKDVRGCRSARRSIKYIRSL